MAAAVTAPESLGTEETMEEGELSDDGMEEPETPIRVRQPIHMDIPDLLKELTGAEEFKKVDPETVNRMAKRAERFNMSGKSVSYEEISKLYRSMQVSQSEREMVDRLEMIYVWGPELDLADVQKFFSPYHPLSVDQVGRVACQVTWATSVNAARAMLGLSKGIGIASTERVVKHVLGAEEEEGSFVTESEVGVDLIHPEDIGVELPPDGPWRLATSDSEGVMLLRFGRKTDLSMRERHAAARHVGVLSKTKKEELLMEQEKALQKEAEKKKPVDKKNPWGNAAESWAIETRGRMGNDFDDSLAAYTRERGRAKRDWDDPVEEGEEVEEVGRKSGGIRGRLGWGAKATQEDTMEGEEGDEDMEWAIKMKRPRMGMVADIVEKGSTRSRLGHGDSDTTRRKVARRSGDLEDENRYQDLKQKRQVEDRVIRTADRRLLNDRFAGGRLAGRIGLGGSSVSDQSVRPRLADRLGSRPHADDMLVEEGREDSLERDMGDDLRGMMDLKNMVVKVTRSEGERGAVRERADTAGRDRNRDRGGERNKQSVDREEEIRQRLKQIKREKEMIDEEKRHKNGSSKHARKDKDRGREDRGRDGESSAILSQIKERAKKLEKYKSKRKESSDESDSDSSESDNSESESSEESSESESESSEEESESNESSSSDSEEEERRQKERRKERASSSRHKPPSSSREKPRESKHGHKSSEKRSGKSSGSGKKETAEELKKAEELRDQLRNYLKKAKEAKEKKRK